MRPHSFTFLPCIIFGTQTPIFVFNFEIIVDVDLLFKKISVGIINNNNNKLYGMVKNYLSLGGGGLKINKYNLINCNGFSNKYCGWGSEDIDFGYRLNFSNAIINM